MTQSEQTSPDELLETFKGHSMKKIIIFTVIIHAILILGTSGSFLYGWVTGGNTPEQKPEERMEEAVREATAAIREIAAKYDIKPQELSSQFADGKPKAPSAPEPEEAAADPAEAEPATEPAEPEKTLSSIEKELQKTAPAPELPPVEEEVDLFK